MTIETAVSRSGLASHDRVKYSLGNDEDIFVPAL
jgi:hypothetical protein